MTVLVVTLPLIAISAVVLHHWLNDRPYDLSSASLSLIGAPDQTLAAKLSYDKTNATFYLNRSAKTPATPSLLSNPALANPVVAGERSGGYSLNLGSRLRNGMTVYDQATNLSLTLDPELTTLPGRDAAGHIVYPIKGGGQAVYTVKLIGLQEDLVYAHPVSNSMSVRYRLELPSSTIARQLPSGAIGIYSTSPGSSVGSSKEYLVFALSAPVVATERGVSKNPPGVTTTLSLSGDQLSMKVTGLDHVHGLFSIDPSVVVPSALSFMTGNNDGDISYGPTGTSISEAGLTGGTLGSWTTATSLPVGVVSATSVAYNGYVYEIGGRTTSGALATVYYAPINSNGSIGSWTATTSLPTTNEDATSVAYKGYVFELGGDTETCTNCYAPIATVDYAPINSNGTLGSWTATTSLPAGVVYATSVAYNGYVYEIGGNNGSTTATVDYAPINSNGTLGTWAATASLPTATEYATAVVSAGYIYELGGNNGITTVDYATINSNGTLGPWTAASSLPAGVVSATSVAYNGYVYEIGGVDTSRPGTVDYAQIEPAGWLSSPNSSVIDNWATTSSAPSSQEATSVAYNGYVYEIGGDGYSGVTANVYYALINANGTLGSWTATTSLPTATYFATSVAYNGYVYEMGVGGDATVDYAPINSNGTLGAWTATTSLPAAQSGATSVVYNGYVYEIGGSSASVDYASISSNGTLGAWTATTSLPKSTGYATSVAYGGYVYEIGGDNGSTAVATAYFAKIEASGALGSWTTTTSLPAADASASSVAYNGYVYEIGGDPGSTIGDSVATVDYAPINSNGTLGSWTATVSLPTATGGTTSVVYNGYVYLIGGWVETTYTAVDYALINNGGPGTVSAWVGTTSLPTATGEDTSVAFNGYIYEIGGTGSADNVVDYATINSNGTLGSWISTTSLPTPTDSATSVAYNGYVYEIGGYGSGGFTATVDYAPINSNGSLGSWTATTSLPTATESAISVAYNGYVYEIGGTTGSGALNSSTTTVDYAPINSNGSLGSWTATTSLPPISGFGTSRATSVAYNGYVYEIGGWNGNNHYGSVTATAEFAQVNSNGTLGSWTATTSLPTVTEWATSVAYNGYIYEIGGYETDTTVDYAPIDTNGTLGPWTATTSLPTSTENDPSAAYNGYVYEFSGGAVDYAALQSLPRIAHYSMLVDLSGSSTEDPTPIELLSSGSDVGNPGIGSDAGPGLGGVSVQYRFATNACTAFNPSSTLGSSGPLLGASLAFNYATDGCGDTTDVARYAWISYTLDDSQTATFPDVSSNHTSITTLDLYYHPATVGRLRGGATFSNGSLQSLDAPPTPGAQ